MSNALCEAEKKIQGLEANRSDAAWQTDTLKLCHDASMCAKLLAAAVQNDKTRKLAKLTHLKEQNSIGASLVATFTKKFCHHVPAACPTSDQELAVWEITNAHPNATCYRNCLSRNMGEHGTLSPKNPITLLP